MIPTYYDRRRPLWQLQAQLAAGSCEARYFMRDAARAPSEMPDKMAA